MTYKPFDVVVVPFPFADRDAQKRRPALVISAASFQSKSKHTVLAMITSADQSDWPEDTEIKDLEKAGLPHASKVRMKLFTLDDRLIIRKTGSLDKTDTRAVRAALKRTLSLS